jgi:hypothetical protein
VSGAEVVAGGETDVDAESVAGGLDVDDSGADESVGSGSADSGADDESDGEPSVGAGVGTGTGFDVGPAVGSGSGEATPTIADRVVLGDVSAEVPLEGDAGGVPGDVEADG